MHERMRSFPLVALLLCAPALPACLDAGDVGGPQPGDDDPGEPPPAGTPQLAGDITADAAWSGLYAVTGNVTIKPGVTVTVAAGTTLSFADAAGLIVEGTLKVQGQGGSLVTFKPSGGDWSGVLVAAGGTLDMTYAELTKAGTAVECVKGAVSCTLDHVHAHDNQQTASFATKVVVTSSVLERSQGSGVYVSDGDVSITDSRLTTAGGDILVQSGGSLRVDYSEIGKVVDSYEHCGIHINKAAALVIEHSLLHSNVVGAMIGGTANARINSSNWESNSMLDVQIIGANTGLDLRGNYWDKGAPTGDFDATGAVASPLTVGPRTL
jgi:hypothetical protein